MAALYMSGERPTYSEPGGEPERNAGELHLVASAVIDLVGVACDAGLLAAVAKQLPLAVLAWVVAAPLRGVGQVVLAVLVCVKYHARSSMVYVDAVFTGIFLMCLVFFANVCLNYYRVMQAKKRRVARAEARWRAARAGQAGSSRNSLEVPSGASWLSGARSGATVQSADSVVERRDVAGTASDRTMAPPRAPEVAV